MKRIKPISDEINRKLYQPFPKPPGFFLSHYEYIRRFVEISSQGYYSKCKLITTLFNWAFIRSLVASEYSVWGPPCYDPCTVFLLDVFRVLDNFPSIGKFCNTLADRDAGRSYRTYSGITDSIPSEGTFTNHRKKIGPKKYDTIHSILVQIAYELHMVTGRIISFDGCLFRSHAKYKGCTYADKGCNEIRVNGDFIQKTRYRILDMLKDLDNLVLGKERRSFSHCLGDNFPEDTKPPSIEVVAWKLVNYEQESHDPSTEKLLGIEKELRECNLMLKPIRSNISKVEPNLKEHPVYVRCPKIPSDLDAKTGHRRDKVNPDKTEYVFGYNLVTATSVEPELGMELPLSSFVGNGFLHEGSVLIPIKKRIQAHHPYFETGIVVADAGYDDTDNYKDIRSSKAVPFIDYNVRGEKVTQEAILKRGYNHNGWPLSPCNLPAKPNGNEKDRKRILFACFKRCLANVNDVPLKDFIPSCPHKHRPLGFTKHLNIDDHPRLLNEVPRGTKRYKKVKNLRTSSERINSSLKDDLNILDDPVVMNLPMAAMVAAIGNISVFLKRIMDFIVRITLIQNKKNKAGSFKEFCDHRAKLHPKTIPKSLISLIKPHPLFGNCSE